MKYFIKALLFFPLLAIAQFSSCQYTHQDSLRGSLNPEREWWDVRRYDISVKPDYALKTIEGNVSILFNVVKPGHIMQIDLQNPMIIDSVSFAVPGRGNKARSWLFSKASILQKDGNAWRIEIPGKLKSNSTAVLKVFYHGKPRQAMNPPWDGGWIWKKDTNGRPWMSVACQGLGASVWYPCKDHQSDEPDEGATLTMTVADSLVAVGNGRLVHKKSNGDGTSSWAWQVKSPINNYDIIPYIGKYVTWHDEFEGENGKLDLDYWVLDYNLEKAKKQFGRDVKPMLKCFEYWFGPYPFYQDGYKLVESPHLGMEHQSAVAYGNKFMNGYLGMDLSGSGWGKDWDYIIVHESGHEWFGNNITTNDIADMWVHEGFTDYSEPLFVECQYGKQAADEYCQGLRRNIDNDKPVIGPYGVNKEGSGDMYAKGANMLHTIRQVIDNDSLFRQILRGLNKDFYHKTVDSKDVESYISRNSGIDFSKIFDQYLRTVKVPVLEYKVSESGISYRWTNCVTGFDLKIRVNISPVTQRWIAPTTEWQTTEVIRGINGTMPEFDRNFYVETKLIE